MQILKIFRIKTHLPKMFIIIWNFKHFKEYCCIVLILETWFNKIFPSLSTPLFQSCVQFAWYVITFCDEAHFRLAIHLNAIRLYVVCKLCVPFYAYYIDLKPNTQTTFLTFFKGDNVYANWHGHIRLRGRTFLLHHWHTCQVTAMLLEWTNWPLY